MTHLTGSNINPPKQIFVSSTPEESAILGQNKAKPMGTDDEKSNQVATQLLSPHNQNTFSPVSPIKQVTRNSLNNNSVPKPLVHGSIDPKGASRASILLSPKKKSAAEMNKTCKQTPLHLAAQAGQEEEVRHLLQKDKTLINARDLSGKTPLFLAVLQGHRNIVQLLLQQGADGTISSEEQETVLHAAAFYGHTLILQDLLQDPSIQKCIHSKDSDGKIPLHKAVFGDPKPDIVQLLLDQGSDPNATNAYGYTPLHWACMHGHVQSLDILLKKGARLDMANANHDLPLDLAIRWGKDEIFHSLMKTTQRLPEEDRLEKIPDDIEGYYFASLIKTQKEQLFEEQIIYLLRLGDFYIQKQELIKAAKIFNGALAVLQKHKINPLIENYLFNRLAQLEARFLESFGLKASMRPIIERRAQLKKIRETLWNNKGDIQETLAHLTQEYKGLLKTLIVGIQSLLGAPPVKWACIGLGSMSRGEMSPYSDLEFAFLLEKNTEEAFKYFRTLSQILELRIINLGETCFPIFAYVDPFHPSLTPGGFSLDTGGNTPLGVADFYELIGTPQQLAQFEEIQWMERNIILSNAMSTVCRIAGDEELFSQYNQEKIKVLDKKQSSKKTNREELAFRLLQGHLDEFRPNLSQEKEKIRAFGIKKELYRPFQEGLSCLALYYNLQENNTFARINELHKLQVFSAKGAENLKKAIARVLSLRFEAHHFYQEEQEYLCHPEEGKPLDPSLLYVNPTHLEALHAIYRILLPFHKSMEAFFRTKDKKTLKSDFYEEGPAVQAQVFEKTLQYQKAQEAYQQAVALDPNDVEALLYLGKINNTLGNSQEALERAQQALKIAIQKYGEEHPDVATCLNNLGSAWKALGDAKKAITYYERALAIDEKIYGKDHPTVAICLNNLGSAWEI